MSEQNGLKERIFEENYYTNLSLCLEKKEFAEIKYLIDNSIDLDFFIDPKKIPNRFEIISNLLIDCIQTLNLGEIFNILRFINKYNLVEKDLTESEIAIIDDIKKDNLLITNLIDLFGNISNSFILYVRKVMPFNLLYYYYNFFSEYSFYSNEGYDINIILDYLNEYNVYGLNVKLLGKLEAFINSFKKKLKSKDDKFIKLRFANKYHLVSPNNLYNNLEKINSQNYNFYSLSMVILNGIGPQGLGFTFSTPKGEVIEICSDIKQNEAIIIKYKQFLTEQFLFKLREDLLNIKIPDSVITKLSCYLQDLLKPKSLINFYKKDIILQKINYFFEFSIRETMDKKNKFKKLLPEISNTIAKILRPIRLIDQFKVRMDLIAENKLRSEDIAKLTSLKEKSNYDVLRERFFLQYIVDWFHELYLAENSK